MPCQPDVVGLGRIVCCLHLPRVLKTLSGVSLCVCVCALMVARILLLVSFLVDYLIQMLYVCVSPEYAEEVWLHHTLVGAFPWRAATANGKPVPEFPGGHDLPVPVSHSAAGRRDGQSTGVHLGLGCGSPVVRMWFRCGQGVSPVVRIWFTWG